MRPDVVSQILRIPADAAMQRIGRAPEYESWESKLAMPIFRAFGRSRRLLAVGLFAGAAFGALVTLRGRSQLPGGPFWSVVLSAAMSAFFFILLPYLGVSWLHRLRHAKVIQGIDDVFATQRVTKPEWDEAKRLLSLSAGSDLLEFGVDRRFDAKCLP